MMNPGEKNTMTLKQKDLDIIGDYVQKKLPIWLDSLSYPRSIQAWDIELRERIVRIEEELKNQRELMKQGFEQVDRRIDQVEKHIDQVEKHIDQVEKRIDQVEKRIDQVDKRIDQVDRRFEQFEKRLTIITVLIGTGFTMVTVLMSIFKFIS
ncbi:MAG TPA: hypothetical protein PK573_14915 [Spirochaetota bacterium]|nr:hypothetical protein [Spirochaetota bacterium]HSA15297.1 hypothetical protein [Spirochaetota bacterium]